MSGRPSLLQIERLVEFLEENPGIAKGLLRTTHGKLETKKKWAALASSINALGGAIKDGPAWAKYWAEKKCVLKKQCAQLSASITRTGGGTAGNLPMLSALDQRLVAVMGGQDFATGDSRLSINPFPETNTPAELPDHDYLVVAEDLDVNMPTSPVPGTSQDDITQATLTSSAIPRQQGSNPRPQRRRSSRQRNINSDLERFASIEERRVEAERMTAEAFANMANSFQSYATGMQSISNALANMANALNCIGQNLAELVNRYNNTN